jgi:hypothetical protein
MLSATIFLDPPMAPSFPFHVTAGKESTMERQGDEVHLNETEATAGVKQQGVRYVLGFSLLLVVIALSAIWILGSIL